MTPDGNPSSPTLVEAIVPAPVARAFILAGWTGQDRGDGYFILQRKFTGATGVNQQLAILRDRNISARVI